MDAAAVFSDSHLFNDLNFDSLDTVEYVMKIEEKSDASIPDGQATEVKTVQQAVDSLLPLLD